MSSTGFGANGKDSVAIRNAEESKTQNSSVAKEKGGNSNETSASDSVHSKRTATNPSTSLNGVIGLAASKRKILSSGSETARKKVENAFRRGEATSGDVVSKRPCAGDKVSKRPSTGDGSTKIERKRSFPSPSSKLGEEGDGQAATDTEKVKIGSTFLDSDSKDVATNADNKTIKNKTLGSQNGSSSKKPDGVTAADSKTVKSIGPLLSSTNGSTYNSSDRRTQDVSKEKANNPSKVISTSRPSTALGSSELFGAQGVDQWNLGTEGDKQTSDNSSVGESHAQPGDGQKQQEVPQQHQRQKSYVRPKITKRRRANDELDAEYDKGRTPRKARRGNNDGANGMNCFDVASERRRTADTVGAAEINKA